VAQVLDTESVVRGGQAPLPKAGTKFSDAYGRTLEEAAAGVVHSSIRNATAGAIRAAGGTVDHAPEAAYPGGPINARHVHITEGRGMTVFGDIFPDPVPKQDRVPARPRE